MQICINACSLLNECFRKLSGTSGGENSNGRNLKKIGHRGHIVLYSIVGSGSQKPSPGWIALPIPVNPDFLSLIYLVVSQIICYWIGNHCSLIHKGKECERSSEILFLEKIY